MVAAITSERKEASYRWRHIYLYGTRFVVRAWHSLSLATALSNGSRTLDGRHRHLSIVSPRISDDNETQVTSLRCAAHHSLLAYFACVPRHRFIGTSGWHRHAQRRWHFLSAALTHDARFVVRMAARDTALWRQRNIVKLAYHSAAYQHTISRSSYVLFISCLFGQRLWVISHHRVDKTWRGAIGVAPVGRDFHRYHDVCRLYYRLARHSWRRVM